MLIKFSIDFDIGKQVHTEDGVYEYDEEEQAAYVHHPGKGNQKGHEGPLKCTISLEEKKHPRNPEGSDNGCLRTQVERGVLRYQNTE